MQRVDMLLQRLEGSEPSQKHEGDLAVEQRRLSRKTLQRLGDRRKAHGPIKPTPAEQRDFVAALPRDDAIAVILNLVQPAGAVGHLVDEGGKLRRDEFRRYRAAGFRRFLAVPAEAFAVGVFF